MPLKGTPSPVSRFFAAPGFPFMPSMGRVTQQSLHFAEALPLRSGATLADYTLVYRDLRHAQRRQEQRGAGLPCAQRQPPRGRRRRQGPPAGGTTSSAPAAAGHRPLLRHRRQQPGLVLRQHRADAREPGHRPRVRRRLPVVTVEDWVDAQARLLTAWASTNWPRSSAAASAACRR